MIEKQTNRARDYVDRIFRTGRIDGVGVDISRGHQVRWGEPLNTSWFGIPDGNRKYVVEPATIDIEDFIRVQNATRPSLTLNDFKSGAYGKTVQRAKETIQLGNGAIPTPVLEIRYNGKISQEGRSRAIGAMRGGATRMPIWIAKQVYK